MKIKFLKNIEIEIFSSSRKQKGKPFLFMAGDLTEINICDGYNIPEASEIQFGDGDVSFVTPEFWGAVEIVEKD